MFYSQLISRGRVASLFCCSLLCLSANSAFADLIPNAISGVTGTAFQQGDSASGNGSISRVLDGSGLTVGNPADSSTWTHNAAWEDGWQGNGSFVPNNTPGAWFVADLGASHSDLGRVWIWNVREVLDRGAQNVNLYYATSPSIAPATGSGYSFGSGGWTLWGNYNVPQAPGGATAADTSIVLAGIPAARYIGFEMLTNYGSNFRVGFAELQITTPEPGSCALLIMGTLGMIAVRRRSSRE